MKLKLRWRLLFVWENWVINEIKITTSKFNKKYFSFEGRYSAMIDFILTHKDLMDNSEIYIKLLQECPSIELADLIMENLVSFISIINYCI